MSSLAQSRQSPSDRQAALMDMIHREYPGYHPLLAMIAIAHNSHASLETQLAAHKAVASFTLPTFKAIEASTTTDTKQHVTVTLYDPRSKNANQEITDVVPL